MVHCLAGMKVFAVTTVFSILAYLWLIFVLLGTSKNEVGGNTNLNSAMYGSTVMNDVSTVYV